MPGPSDGRTGGTGGRPLTLAACVGALGPGDPCPCCGERLVAARRSSGLCAPDARGRAGRDGGAAECPKCGCEVETVDDVPQTSGDQILCVAA